MQALARQIEDPSAYEPPVKWLLEQPIRYAKTTELWTRTATADYVKANPCNDYAATNVDTATELTIYLPSMRRTGPPYPSGDPNVLAGVVITYQEAADGLLLCKSPYMQARIDTVVGWEHVYESAPYEIPGGWAVCDGVSHCRNCSSAFGGGATCAVCGEDVGVYTTKNYGGYRLVHWIDGGLDLGEGEYGNMGDDGDYAEMGDTGGYAWHGWTENNHPNHGAWAVPGQGGPHIHKIPTSYQVAAGSDYWVPGSDEDEWLNTTSPKLDELIPTGNQGSNFILKHGGRTHEWVDQYYEYHEYKDTDNRGPWIVVAKIQRMPGQTP